MHLPILGSLVVTFCVTVIVSKPRLCVFCATLSGVSIHVVDHSQMVFCPRPCPFWPLQPSWPALSLQECHKWNHTVYALSRSAVFHSAPLSGESLRLLALCHNLGDLLKVTQEVEQVCSLCREVCHSMGVPPCGEIHLRTLVSFPVSGCCRWSCCKHRVQIFVWTPVPLPLGQTSSRIAEL